MVTIKFRTGRRSDPQPLFLPATGLCWTASDYEFKQPPPEPPAWAKARIDFLSPEEIASDDMVKFREKLSAWTEKKDDREDRFYHRAVVWYGRHRYDDPTAANPKDMSMTVHETVDEIASLVVKAGGVIVDSETSEVSDVVD